MGLSNKLSCETESFSCCCNPHRFLQPEVMRLSFPALEPWVAWSVSLPSCSSQLVCTKMWDIRVQQPPPRLPQSITHSLAACPHRPGCPSLPLLLVWVNVSSLTPWLSDFHTIGFSGRCGYFLFLNWLLSFFWLCKEVKHIYLWFPCLLYTSPSPRD